MKLTCPACHATRLAARWDASRLGPGKAIAWCAACGLGWQSPLPTPEAIRHYYATRPVYNIHAAGEKESLFAQRLGALRRLRPQRGDLLDVGSGLGHFLALARRDGWRVTGVEPQAAAAEHARRALGVGVHEGLLADLDLPPASVDVITLWDVLEHLHDPLGMLDACRRLLRPGGLLAFAIPNASGLPARLFRGDWRYVMPTHLFYFTLPTMTRLLTERGLTPVATRHTLKAQSLLTGLVGRLGLPIDAERLVRLGRRPAPRGQPPASETDATARTVGHHARTGQPRSLAGVMRRTVLALNRAPLPLPLGDLVDIYAAARDR